MLFYLNIYFCFVFHKILLIFPQLKRFAIMRKFMHCFARVTKQFLLITLFLAISLASFAQKKIVGKVVDPEAKPLMGVTVSVKGTAQATSTATDGSYSIDLPVGKNTLLFSSIGYEMSEIKIDPGMTNLDLILKLVSNSLNEVVVTG